MPFLRRGAETFSPDRHFRQLSGGFETPVGNAEGAVQYWILARSQYRVKFLSLQHVAANRREAAIKLEIATWTPFAKSSHYVIPQPGGAILLAWDADAVATAMSTAEVADRGLIVLPESAWQPAAPTGISLHRCLEGVEAVIQSNNDLVSSLWWRDIPDDRDWMNFLRTSGLDSAQWPAAPPPASTRQWLPQPRGHTPGGRTFQMASQEAWALAATAFLFALATIWYANDWRRYAQAQSASEQRLAATERDLDGVLGARGTALTALVRAESLGTLFNRNDALKLLATLSDDLAKVTKPGALQLAELEWRDQHLVLVLSVNGPPVSATSIVKAFEENPAFRDVQVSPDGNRLRVEMRVVSGTHPAGTTKDTKL